MQLISRQAFFRHVDRLLLLLLKLGFAATAENRWREIDRNPGKTTPH
ncbi:MAG: hypothetical protein WB791_04620 [Waddliaceae bacterium]